MITLEKIDIIRERTGVSYKDAKEALEQNNGDIIETIIFIEEKHGRSWMDTMSIMGNEVVAKLKTIIKKGNVSRIVLKKDGEILLNVPVTAGALGVMIYPMLSLLGISAALITKASIEIIKDNGEVIDINEMTEDTVSELKNMVKNKKCVNSNKTKKTDDITIDEESQNITPDDLDDEYY